ncbi:MAG: hypothetical protein H6662_11760 [Ardenticatenaceae bacterium]|nr:hypothetical protein [Anaerolineales bacterium]MCB8922251.1 hypothetical protein [Ardenticatenaceae bacterium]MCB8990564.1 hypothetical protein [Ardenticatenaceae bacterium]
MYERNPVQVSVDDETFLDQVAGAICRYGLRFPALLALQTGHPATFLGGQLLWVAQPALSLFLPTHLVRRMAALLEDPQAVCALVTRLESMSGVLHE